MIQCTHCRYCVSMERKYRVKLDQQFAGRALGTLPIKGF
jgi:hypothetical protein